MELTPITLLHKLSESLNYIALFHEFNLSQNTDTELGQRLNNSPPHHYGGENVVYVDYLASTSFAKVPR